MPLGIANTVGTVMGGTILQARRPRRVWSDWASTDYQGEILGKGSTVQVVTLVDVPTGVYDESVGGAGFDSLLTRLSATTQSLTIDQAVGFAFLVTNIEEALTSAPLREAATASAAANLEKGLDTFLANLAATSVPAANKFNAVGAPLAVTSANAYNLLVDLAEILDVNEAPDTDRVAIVMPYFRSALRKSDDFISYGTAANDDRLRNGRIGEAAGMIIVTSNRFAKTGAVDTVVVMHKSAINLAEALRKIRTNPSLKYSGDQVDGIHVYGAKAFRPDNIAVAYVTKGA